LQSRLKKTNKNKNKKDKDHGPSPTLGQGGGVGVGSIVRSIKNAKKFADLGTCTKRASNN